LKLQALLDMTNDQGAYGNLVLTRFSNNFSFLQWWKL
jgi:hypothetical protein